MFVGKIDLVCFDWKPTAATGYLQLPHLFAKTVFSAREVCQPSGQFECIIFCNMIMAVSQCEIWRTRATSFQRETQWSFWRWAVHWFRNNTSFNLSRLVLNLFRLVLNLISLVLNLIGLVLKLFRLVQTCFVLGKMYLEFSYQQGFTSLFN